jgi:hypothetical protein
LVAFAGALILSYWPVLATFGPKTLHISVPLWVLGSVVFPAVFLTLATSGSAWNLRPDRVVKVMRQCAAAYVPMVLLWMAASALYAGSLFTTTILSVTMSRPTWGVRVPSILGYPALFAAIYLTHLFCWYLGLLYRKHHEAFPWVLQRHIPTRKFERRVPRRPRRAPAAAPGGAAPAPVPVAPLPLEPRPNARGGCSTVPPVHLESGHDETSAGADQPDSRQHRGQLPQDS